MKFPKKLSQRLQQRKENDNFRQLQQLNYKIDFLSNDYLGYAQNKSIAKESQSILKSSQNQHLGSTGSRLISGNYNLIEELEQKAEQIFNAESALFFNSGYDANIGLLSAVLQPKDLVIYDELCHASIRDGLQMCKAKSYKFKHNNYEDLSQKITNQQNRLNPQNIYIVTESVFSMDGDQSDIKKLLDIAQNFEAYLILDEAHGLGICGQDFKGLSYNYSDQVFARILTCGKSLGSHGAFVLGSSDLKSYLVNFCKPFIYTTAASPHQVASVFSALNHFEMYEDEKLQLQKNIKYFRKQLKALGLESRFIESYSAIQSFKISGNTQAKTMAKQLQGKGFGVKAILHPTVPKGEERIRICLHSFNTEQEISDLLKSLYQL